ncbi:MAG: signal recognition particle protein [Planctomycetota bacterium]
MFENLTRRFSGILGGLFRRKISEGNIRETLREIRVALLEADVAFEVVNDFLARVEKEALGERVLKGVDPGQQFIAIVYEAMVQLMGPVDTRIRYREGGVTTILMAGLQGSGKTTTCGKLALLVREEHKRKPLLVAADVQRPAAIEQLKKLGGDIGVPVYSEAGAKPPAISRNAQEFARREGFDTVILDTAGRLHIDEQMMAEVREVARLTSPDEILLVCDAMTGQDAVRSARAFNEQLELTGVVLTKLDGDARGGAAISVKAVTGKPIKFVGVGEKLEGTLEEFRPEGMAQRILGYGDVVELVRKARRVVDEKRAAEFQEKLLEAKFDLNDFLEQIRNVKKMGSLKDLLKMVPGFGAHVDELDVDDDEIVKIEAMIQSMTSKERARPEILNTSRRDRIARGAGVSRPDLDDVLKQFSLMKKFMGEFSRLGGKGPLGKIKAVAQARRQLADIGGMMRKVVAATAPLPKAAKAASGEARARPSKEEIRRRRKLEREARRKNRRR